MRVEIRREDEGSGGSAKGRKQSGGLARRETCWHDGVGASGTPRKQHLSRVRNRPRGRRIGGGKETQSAGIDGKGDTNVSGGARTVCVLAVAVGSAAVLVDRGHKIEAAYEVRCQGNMERHDVGIFEI